MRAAIEYVRFAFIYEYPNDKWKTYEKTLHEKVHASETIK